MKKKLQEQVLALRAQGKTYSEISSELNCSKSLVSYYCNPEGKNKSRVRSEEQRIRRLTRLQKLKEEKPCADCGQFFEGFLMDFDHLPGLGKTVNVSDAIRLFSWDRVEEEIAKCDVVCCMCHRKRTRSRWESNPLAAELE